jgi:hypothetical protein
VKPPAGAAYLNRFEDLCDLVGCPNMYVAYMLESGDVHPSGVSADVYLTEREGKPQLSPVPTRPGVPLRAAAVFAGTATNEFGELVGDDRLTEFAGRDGGDPRGGPGTVVNPLTIQMRGTVGRDHIACGLAGRGGGCRTAMAVAAGVD